jgi:hypothetical protein
MGLQSEGALGAQLRYPVRRIVHEHVQVPYVHEHLLFFSRAKLIDLAHSAHPLTFQGIISDSMAEQKSFTSILSSIQKSEIISSRPKK